MSPLDLFSVVFCYVSSSHLVKIVYDKKKKFEICFKFLFDDIRSLSTSPFEDHLKMRVSCKWVQKCEANVKNNNSLCHVVVVSGSWLGLLQAKNPADTERGFCFNCRDYDVEII